MPVRDWQIEVLELRSRVAVLEKRVEALEEKDGDEDGTDEA